MNQRFSWTNSFISALHNEIVLHTTRLDPLGWERSVCMYGHENWTSLRNVLASSKADFAPPEINYVNLCVGRDRIEAGNLRNLCKLKTASLQWAFPPNQIKIIPLPFGGRGATYLLINGCLTFSFLLARDSSTVGFKPCHHTPSVANRTKLNQKPIEPNRTQSFDWSSIGPAIEHNRTRTFLWVRLSSITEPNRTQSTWLVRFCSVEKQNGIQNWWALTLSRIGRNSLFNWVLTRGASVTDINTSQWPKIFV